MKSFSDVLLVEKNKLFSPYPWVPLFHFDFTAPVGDIYLVGNISDITYGGQVYTAFDIQVELPEDNNDGSIPECTIAAANQSRAFEEMITQTNGGVDSSVTITVVNTNNLTEDYTELTWNFNILQVECAADFVTMVCSLYSPLDKRFPPERYYNDHCRYKYFKGVECKYSGANAMCDRSLDQCILYGNSINFGGFPGILDADIAFIFNKSV